jgi:GGDEF domain-containing protein
VGGDEVVVIVEPWDRAERASSDAPGFLDDRVLAIRVAERIADAMRAPIKFNGVAYVVTVSVGIAYGDNERSARSGALTGGLTADEALHAADLAMYRAKDRGKNRYELAGAGPLGAIPAQQGAGAPVQ